MWAMSTKVVVVNPIEQLIGLLGNLIISKDLVDQVKLGQLEDEELTMFAKKIFRHSGRF